ncbi:TetR/AcrR family transcriptional regulator [Nocardia neocaledoniensis]|uniref:TetR/AcrR family transcriptional regulator n=1 Tax=Nocardia neocaledoniensis TaxID=236511 RepID=UPI0024589BFB|nr:TetR family transcriptional regulator [Nocardia neocaledoniensis]
MASKREQILDAAIDLLGERGARALTHRGVDETAGAPLGSTSNYFRTREALLIGIAERLEHLDRGEWEPTAQVDGPPTLDDFVDAMARFVQHATGPGRARTLARLALFGEAQTMPALRDSLHRAHRRIRDHAIVLAATVGFDAADTGILVDYLDGVIVHRLSGAETGPDPRAALRRLVDALRTDLS